MDSAALPGRQHDVLSRAQALAAGLTDAAISWRLQRGEWRRLFPGVYLTHNGTLTWMGRAWATVLHGGEGSALGMLGAWHLHGVTDRPPPGLVLMVSADGRARPDPPRLVVRRRRGLTVVRSRGLPVTSVEDTVLDLGGIPEASLDDAIGHAARAVQRRLTTAERIAVTLAGRARHPHRSGLRLALGDIDAGAESVLEVGVVHGVLRRHRLPAFVMQVADRSRGRSIRRDFVNEEFRVILEVDGELGHAGPGMWADRRRDRAAARDGWLSLRCGWVDVRHGTCELALDIALSLRSRGWRGTPRACGPMCPAGDDRGAPSR